MVPVQVTRMRKAAKIKMQKVILRNDSGVFVLQLLLAYNGKTHFHFTQEHSKPLRESLTYYLCAHEEKELIMPEIRQIAYQHVIKLENYTARTKRYSKK
ncbi:uncharacterized protein LOC120645215 isoform X2 [Panicum virgatum]|uniref:uncharacterized protein LOC120645215 isoform X2 n=1 Tax=Panicum virgatum TaxID=38727 RepID=UPI0019D51ECA|nr:uncharacterized protein LOC120645215 isoform X2 [Panicum virgatum]XP_039777935.1 uncharacterized protein LOC120645215 isoform X2 [Panicum virgatum]